MTSIAKSLSRLRSHLFWKNAFEQIPFVFEGFDMKNGTHAEWMAKNENKCPFCDGFMRSVERDTGEEFFCLCSMLKWAEDTTIEYLTLESITTPAKINQLEGNNFELVALKQAVKSWIVNPSKNDETHKPWFYIYGGKGCGKTHILRALKSYWGPFAFYISAEELQQRFQDFALKEFVQKVAASSILLVDDVGIEHKGGTGYFISQLSAIINMRSNRGANDWPVIMTSNIPISNLVTSTNDDIQRLGSRMADRKYVQVHKLTQQDYRLHGAAK